MKIAMQCWTELGSYSNPRDNEDDVFRGTITECKEELRAWYAMHLDFYDEKTARENIRGNCYYGDEIGEYPDFQLVIGPRGGVNKISC